MYLYVYIHINVWYVYIYVCIEISYRRTVLLDTRTSLHRTRCKVVPSRKAAERIQTEDRGCSLCNKTPYMYSSMQLVCLGFNYWIAYPG